LAQFGHREPLRGTDYSKKETRLTVDHADSR